MRQNQANTTAAKRKSGKVQMLTKCSQLRIEVCEQSLHESRCLCPSTGTSYSLPLSRVQNEFPLENLDRTNSPQRATYFLNGIFLPNDTVDKNRCPQLIQYEKRSLTERLQFVE